MKVPSHLNFWIAPDFIQLHKKPGHQNAFAAVFPGCVIMKCTGQYVFQFSVLSKKESYRLKQSFYLSEFHTALRCSVGDKESDATAPNITMDCRNKRQNYETLLGDSSSF